MKNFEEQNREELVEFEGMTITKNLMEQVLNFREEYKDYIIEKPSIPMKDSNGNDINSNGNPSYVRLIRKEETPTVMKSEDNTAITAYVYSLGSWHYNGKMWQDYVYDGSLGIDYVYIDDIELNSIIDSYKGKIYG